MGNSYHHLLFTIHQQRTIVGIVFEVNSNLNSKLFYMSFFIIVIAVIMLLGGCSFLSINKSAKCA